MVATATWQRQSGNSTKKRMCKERSASSPAHMQHPSAKEYTVSSTSHNQATGNAQRTETKLSSLMSPEEVTFDLDEADAGGFAGRDGHWSQLQAEEADKLLDTNSQYGIDDALRQQHDAALPQPVAELSQAYANAQAPEEQRNNKRSLDGNEKDDMTTCDGHDNGMHSVETAATRQLDKGMEEAERLQAREITELSLEERSDVYEDIHGVRRPVEETDAFRQRHLQRLDHELTVGLYDSKRKHQFSIDDRAMKEAYTMTSFLAPRITSDVDLRLAMLRATRWDAQEAAIKMMKYILMKQKLFGKERCLRPIVFSDLEPDAQESIKSGSIAFHDDRDGLTIRPTVVQYSARWKTQYVLSQGQSSFYTSHIFSRSVRVQQYGMVAVIYTNGASMSHFQRALAFSKFNTLDAMPMRAGALHICFSNPLLKPLLSALFQLMPKDFRLRCKLHCGPPQECNTELMTYGIPASLLPAGEVTAYDPDIAHDTLQKCFQRDQDALDKFYEGKPEHCIDTPPRSTDVLLGRGRPYQKFPGNLDFSAILEKSKESYNHPSTTKVEKTRMTRDLVEQLRESGVRFLKHDGSGDWWEEVSDSVARQRAAMCLRNMLRK